MRIVIAGLCCGILAACMNAPDPDAGQAAGATTPVVLKQQPLATLRQVSAQAQGGNAALLRTLQRALSEDPALIASKLRVDQTIRSAADQNEWFRPSVTTSAQATTAGPNVTLSVTQELYDFGKRDARGIALLARADAERVQTDELRLGLAQRLLSAMIDGQEARDLIALNTRRRTAFVEALDRADSLVELNMATASDRSLASVKLQSAERDLEAAKVDLARAQRAWGRLAIRGADLPSGVSPRRLLTQFGLATLPDAQAKAERNNIALRLARSELNFATLDFQSELKRDLPTVNAVGTVRLDDNSSTKRTNVGLSVDYTLFSREREEELRSREDALFLRRAEIAETERSLSFDVTDLWTEIASANRLSGLDRGRLASLQDRLDTLEQQLPSGLVPFERVIEAQIDLFETEQSAIRNAYDAQRSAARLLILSGLPVAR